jgi:nitroimidazol reductase NimA-like FMN-containing flavoprotein (pyridoxamine 5'-phosphate oxidase superfamily)
MADDADTAGTDLGRRIAEQRARAGLTVAEAATRAGMAPDYLVYLESSASPNPTEATLARLAAAFDAPPSSLSGAGVNLAPGHQRSAAQHPVLQALTTDECREHLAGGGVGRFLFVEPGRGPVAIPVNYATDGDDILFRTGRQTSIADAVGQPQVSFDVDHIDDTFSEGWSVLLSGTARIITEPAELEHAKALGIEPWAPGDRDIYIRMSARQVTGRRIRVDDRPRGGDPD